MGIRFYNFGPFTVDTEEQVLLRHGQPLWLKPKVFDLLVVLVENSGHTVSKDELMKKIWNDRFVEQISDNPDRPLADPTLARHPGFGQPSETVPPPQNADRDISRPMDMSRCSQSYGRIL